GYGGAPDADTSRPLLVAALGAQRHLDPLEGGADASIRDDPFARSIVRNAAALAGAVEGPERQAEALLESARQLFGEGRAGRQAQAQPLEALPARRLEQQLEQVGRGRHDE